MRQDPKSIGIAGEGLFRRLAYHWGASFILTADASATDGYLQWADIPGARLWVQIKTRAEQKGTSRWCSVSIKPSTLAEWYTTRPLLVVCDLRQNRGWWLDTANEPWPWGTLKHHVFRIPFNQPIDASTKDAVRRIALNRGKYDGPFIIQGALTDFVLPKGISLLTAGKVQELLDHAYRQMQSVDVHNRDVIALAVARIIHLQNCLSSPKILHSYLEVAVDRLLSQLMGGRSFSLAALTSLLQSLHVGELDDAFIPVLVDAAELAITQGTFLNPEFGLIVAASLAQHFPLRRDLFGVAEHLTNLVIVNPQNRTVETVAKGLSHCISDNRVKLTDVITRDWLTIHVIRPLPKDAEVFLKRLEADEAAKRVAEEGPSGATPEDLYLNSQVLSLKAAELVDDWLSHD